MRLTPLHPAFDEHGAASFKRLDYTVHSCSGDRLRPLRRLDTTHRNHGHTGAPRQVFLAQP
jgi:hypothetical protein